MDGLAALRQPYGDFVTLPDLIAEIRHRVVRGDSIDRVILMTPTEPNVDPDPAGAEVEPSEG